MIRIMTPHKPNGDRFSPVVLVTDWHDLYAILNAQMYARRPINCFENKVSETSRVCFEHNEIIAQKQECKYRSFVLLFSFLTFYLE